MDSRGINFWKVEAIWYGLVSYLLNARKTTRNLIQMIIFHLLFFCPLHICILLISFFFCPFCLFYPFLCSYFTNSLILPTINGPTEGLMLIYLSHFFTAFVGKVLLLFLFSTSHRISILDLYKKQLWFRFLTFQVLNGGLNLLENPYHF